MLLEKFVQDIPTSAHRMALKPAPSAPDQRGIASSDAGKEADVHELFECCGLSFIESGQVGLFPDLTRKFDC